MEQQFNCPCTDSSHSKPRKQMGKEAGENRGVPLQGRGGQGVPVKSQQIRLLDLNLHERGDRGNALVFVAAPGKEVLETQDVHALKTVLL